MKYYIVDDNIGTCKTLVTMIRSRNIGTVCGYSTDPASAVDEILGDRPDIVMADLLMEGMDGIALVRAVKAKDPSISFVMLSKVTDKDMIQQAYNAGVEFFISKPLNIVEVEKVLENVSERRKMKSIMNNIRGMFNDDPKEEQSRVRPSYVKELDTLFGQLGMLGEKGISDIRSLFQYMESNDCHYDRAVLEAVAEEAGDTPRNIEQRVRRAIKKGLTNAAVIGIEDYGNEAYSVYAGYVFDFKTLKDEMNSIKDGSSGGRVSISKFMDGLALYANSLK